MVTSLFNSFFISPLSYRLLGQVVQAIIDYNLWQDRTNVTNGKARLDFALSLVPNKVWLLVTLSTVLVVLINEAVKLHEIRYSPNPIDRKFSLFHSNCLSQQYSS